MTTKAPASVKEANPDEPIKKIYAMVESFRDVIPVTNERYRLAFNINKFSSGESASLKEALTNANPESCTIAGHELLTRIMQEYQKLGLTEKE